MKKTPLPCYVIDQSFERSGCKLVLTDCAGEMPAGIAKGGVQITRSFNASAVALLDQNNDFVVAPADLVTVERFARRIVDGDPRARTESGGNLLLASAFLALLLAGSEERPVPTSEVA